MPVLSVLIALVAPSVSTSVRFLTTAFASASCLAPSDRRPETNAGMPVGIAEIAIAVPSSSTSLKSSPRATPTATMNATAPQAMIPSTFVSEPSSRWSGERVRVTELSIVAICPICVCMPVAGHDHRGGAARHRGVLEQHVRAVAERDVGAGEHVGVLGDRRALAGQRRLLGLQRRGAQDPPVGRHEVARLDLDEVAGNEIHRRHERDRAVAHDLGLRHLQVRQRVDAGARAELLPRCRAPR